MSGWQIVMAVLAALFIGYQVGTTREWCRVLRYLDIHENQVTPWVHYGIAADVHHEARWRKQANGRGDAHV
jgi:hypothetical protein